MRAYTNRGGIGPRDLRLYDPMTVCMYTYINMDVMRKFIGYLRHFRQKILLHELGIISVYNVMPKWVLDVRAQTRLISATKLKKVAEEICCLKNKTYLIGVV